MYKKGAGNDKQGKDAGNRTLCPYKNFSQAIIGEGGGGGGKGLELRPIHGLSKMSHCLRMDISIGLRFWESVVSNTHILLKMSVQQ